MEVRSSRAAHDPISDGPCSEFGEGSSEKRATGRRNLVEPFEVTGTYTYRSFLNEPSIVGDFNKLQFAESVAIKRNPRLQ